MTFGKDRFIKRVDCKDYGQDGECGADFGEGGTLAAEGVAVSGGAIESHSQWMEGTQRDARLEVAEIETTSPLE